MHKVFYKTTKAVKLSFSDNQSLWKSFSKYSVNQVFSGLLVADRWHYSKFPTHLSSTISFSNPGSVFMFTGIDLVFIMLYLEWFFYGNISVLCALACILAKEVQIFFGLGLYSGIFAIYLQCHLKDPRRAVIVFYVLCLLYALSAATVVCDLLNVILRVSDDSISGCKNIIFFINYAATYQCTINPTTN